MGNLPLSLREMAQNPPPRMKGPINKPVPRRFLNQYQVTARGLSLNSGKDIEIKFFVDETSERQAAFVGRERAEDYLRGATVAEVRLVKESPELRKGGKA
jgi:hypothetical protein